MITQNELDNAVWQNEIDSFTRWKTFLGGISTPAVRKSVIERLHKIQEKYPQYISQDEIPLE